MGTCTDARKALPLLLAVLMAAHVSAAPADDRVVAARDLFEQFVLAEHGEPHDQLEALAHVAQLIDTAGRARAVQPLYREALRSPRGTDASVAAALAEGYAACLRKQRQPLADVAQALRALSREAREGACREAVLVTTARLDRVLAGRAVAGRERGARRLAISHRAERAKARVVSAPNVEDATRGTKRPALPSALTTDTGAARPEMTDISDPGRPAAGRALLSPRSDAAREAARAGPRPLAQIEAFALGVRLGTLQIGRGSPVVRPDGLAVGAAPAGAVAPSVKAPEGRAAAAGPMARLTTPPVPGRVALPELPDVAVAARPAASAIRLRESKGLPRGSLQPIEATHDAHVRARVAAAQAGAAALETLVKSLLAEADWKARKGDHEGAMEALGAVIRDARNSSASALAVQRALPIALTGLRGEDREAILREFEPWVARLGGERDRELAKLLVLQQRYRDGAFVAARDGLKKFLIDHPGSDLAPRARLLLGLATWRTGDLAGAVELLRRLVRERPAAESAPHAQFLVGYLLHSGGAKEEAYASFVQLLRNYPDSDFAAKAVDFVGGEFAKRTEADAEAEPRWRTLPSCEAARAAATPEIDGRVSAREWDGAPTLRLVQADDGKGGRGGAEAEVRLLWDADAFYVVFTCPDADVRADVAKREAGVLRGDAVRVLLAPPAAEGEPQVYYDVAISAAGVLADGKVPFTRGVVQWRDVRGGAAWRGAGIRGTASVDGTLNGEAPDRGWSAELAIPFAALGDRPKAGDVWRVDCRRVDADGKGNRTVRSWAPRLGWLPQPRAFGRVTLVMRP